MSIDEILSYDFIIATPEIYFYYDFLNASDHQRKELNSIVAIDQVINSAAKLKLMSGGQINVPIVFRGPTASAGQLGAQHSQAFENWFANTPGLKVIVPCNPYDAKGLLKAAIRDNDPVIFMESEQMYGDKGEVPEGEYVLPIGVADHP
jgi:pyruvate dehydrogenase E1 component beta subunit